MSTAANPSDNFEMIKVVAAARTASDALRDAEATFVERLAAARTADLDVVVALLWSQYDDEYERVAAIYGEALDVGEAALRECQRLRQEWHDARDAVEAIEKGLS